MLYYRRHMRKEPIVGDQRAAPAIASEEWTVQQCAVHLGVAAATFRSYVARGDCDAPKPVRHVGSTPLWDAAEIRRWNRQRPGKGGRRKAASPNVAS